jgi:hypothetical protein
MWAMPSLFKSLTNFSLIEFEELAQLVVPTIIGHVTSTEGTTPHFQTTIQIDLEITLAKFHIVYETC